MEKLLKTGKEELAKKQAALNLEDRIKLQAVLNPAPEVVKKLELDPVWVATTAWFYLTFYVMPLVILPWIYGQNYLVVTHLYVAPRSMMVPDESAITENDSLHYYKQQFWSKYALPADKQASFGWLLWPVDVF